MDNVTHALAGLLLAEGAVALAARRRGAGGGDAPGLRRAAAIVGVAAAELPDADLLYAGPGLGMGQLGYLLHHRGHTHTVVAALAGALLLWGATMLARRGALAPAERRLLLGLAVAGTLSHLALDYTNSYGVHPFWPLANEWHYGDAVFIVEPWLWVAAIPPLIGVARGAGARAVLGLALAAILAAAWLTGQSTLGAAAALTAGAAAWSAAVAAAPRGRRVALGLAAWGAFEGGAFAAERGARAAVRAAVRDAAGAGTPADAALIPAPANPLCVRALVVELEGATYRVSSAVVAPFPRLLAADGCAVAGLGAGAGTRPSARPATRRVRWGEEWSAPAAELAALAASRCEIAAALRFVRVPAWERTAAGTIRLADLRFGRRGFAAIETAAGAGRCPRLVPPWVPPRQDVVGEL